VNLVRQAAAAVVATVAVAVAAATAVVVVVVVATVADVAMAAADAIGRPTRRQFYRNAWSKDQAFFVLWEEFAAVRILSSRLTGARLSK
jgi:hypothetical protein